jgi:exosortase/archaeosortase family protein
MTLGRSLLLTSLSLAGVLTLFALKAFGESKWTWLIVYDRLGTHIPQLSVEFLPVPFVFLLWLRVVDRERPLLLRLSWLWTTLSLAGYSAFSAITNSARSEGLVEQALFARELFFGTGVIAGLFAAVSFRECVTRALENPRLACVAMVAAGSAFSYYRLIDVLWESMCSWTAQVVFALLRVFDADIYIADSLEGVPRVLISSPWFSINVYIGCSGLEGIFLFMFMLSVLFLSDWEFFKNRRLVLLYAAGIICMFLVNALRIAAFFTVGYWVHRPDAAEWLEGLQGAPLYLFHSYVGWVFYVITFLLFTMCIHRRKRITA